MEFEAAGIAVKCGRTTFWKRRFFVNDTVARVFLKQKSTWPMIIACPNFFIVMCQEES